MDDDGGDVDDEENEESGAEDEEDELTLAEGMLPKIKLMISFTLRISSQL